MGSRNGWLFPLMVLVAGSVTAFGCVGIAAIIGYLPLSPPAVRPSAMQAMAGLPLPTPASGLASPESHVPAPEAGR